MASRTATLDLFWGRCLHRHAELDDTRKAVNELARSGDETTRPRSVSLDELLTQLV